MNVTNPSPYPEAALRQSLATLRRRWWLLLLCALLGGALTAGVLISPLRDDHSCTLAFVLTPTDDSSAAQTLSAAPACLQLLQSRLMERTVCQSLAQDTLGASLSAYHAQGTNLIFVTVSAPERAAVTAVAQALPECCAELGSRISPDVTLVPLQPYLVDVTQKPFPVAAPLIAALLCAAAAAFCLLCPVQRTEPRVDCQQPELVHLDLLACLCAFLAAVRRAWLMMLLAAIVGSAALGALTAARYTPQYEARCVLSIGVETENGQYTYYADEPGVQLAVNNFPQVLSTQQLRQAVCQKLGVSTLDARFSAQILTLNNYVTLCATAPVPQAAHDALQAVLEVYPPLSLQTGISAQLQILQPSAVPNAPAQPLSLWKSLALGALCGAVIGFAAAAIGDARRSKN